MHCPFPTLISRDLFSPILPVKENVKLFLISEIQEAIRFELRFDLLVMGTEKY